MDIVKLCGATKAYLWGGTRLFSYGKTSSEDIIAESWDLSYHPDGPTLIASGPDKGKPLQEVASPEDLGPSCARFDFFPLLIKLIDASKDLSVQVHPSDEYALKYENSLGKTEMWYVVDASENAYLHIGFNKDITQEEVEQRIKNNTLLEVMNHLKVKKGDCYFIPSGTLHAIGAGCFVYEIQENSNLTYRVYDYGRVGKDGKPRELHIEKALKVLSYKKMDPENLQGHPLKVCPYFQIDAIENLEAVEAPVHSFACLTFVKGEGSIAGMPFAQGDSFFLPCGKKAEISGSYKALFAFVSKEGETK